MKSINSLDIECMEKVAASIDLLAEKYPDLDVMSMRIELKIDLGGVCVAGKACRSGLIRLNPIFLKLHREEMLRVTIPHEVAHCFVHQFRLGRGHDRAWKQAMVALGLEPVRCHSFSIGKDAIAIPGRSFAYVCEGCEYRVIFTKRRHNLSLNGRGSYRCRKCSGVFQWQQ